MAARDPNDDHSYYRDTSYPDNTRSSGHDHLSVTNSTRQESLRGESSEDLSDLPPLVSDTLSQNDFTQSHCLGVHLQDPGWLDRALYEDESLILVGETSLSSYVSRLLCSTLGDEISRNALRDQHDVLLSRNACISYSIALDIPKILKYPCFSDTETSDELIHHLKSEQVLRLFFAILGAVTMDMTPTNLYKYLELWLETKIDEQQIALFSSSSSSSSS
jgi:hypothetical protein